MAEAYSFDREFTPDGELASSPGGRYMLREEAMRLIERAGSEGAERAEADIGRHLADIATHLRPVDPALAGIAAQLRREAGELALAAARAVAGAALTERAAEAAAAAIGEQLSCLQKEFRIEIWVAPEHRDRIATLLREHGEIAVCAEDGMVAGDWRIDWDEGEVSFDVEAAMQGLAEIVRRHLDDDSIQGDLFAAEGN